MGILRDARIALAVSIVTLALLLGAWGAGHSEAGLLVLPWMLIVLCCSLLISRIPR